ncbi:MFS transporter [Fodinisporobacter ferrooxydans]|uniref:MFS transporter n=1 Tax=Fodinisporobacter ferrooxydans TaxID=2901836 RepID=A0ABY4CL10_9BACL|nr:MFS transporter [Alicyclobacillaceae bacterium MYW30-H2]
MKSKFIVYLVSFAAFLAPFTQSIYAPMIPEVTNDFHTSAFWVNLTISIFTAFLALMQIIYGPLTDTKGRRSVMLFGIVFYVLATIGCYFSNSIYVLLFFRALQAIGIATGSVVAVTVISDLFEGENRGKAMGTFQMMVSLGPVVGPVVGGFLGGMFGFHSVFLALVIVGLIVFLLNLTFLKETKPEKGFANSFKPRDFITILKDRIGSSIILLGFIQYYAFYNFLVFMPGILSERYGLTAEQKGLVFLPLSLCIVIGSFLGGRAQGRFEGRKFVVLTSYLNVLAILLFTVVSHISLLLLIGSSVLFGLFLGLSLPVQTTLLTQAFQKNRATAIGVYNFVRFMGMALGPIFGSLLLQIGGYYLIYGFIVAVFLGCSSVLHKRLLHATNTMANYNQGISS